MLSAGALLLAGSWAHGAITPSGSTNPAPGNSFWSTGGNSSQTISIGIGSEGWVDIDDGSTLSSGSSYIGYISDGGMTISGNGSTWNLYGSVAIGIVGAGTLNITDGGKVNSTNDVEIGSSSSLNLGVSKNATLLEASGNLVNHGTINIFSLGNLASDTYTIVTAGSFSGSGSVNSWGGIINGSNQFEVSGLTDYAGSTLSQSFSAQRVSIDSGDVIISFADNAGSGDLTLSGGELPAPVVADYFDGGTIDLTGLTNTQMIMSFYLGEGFDEDSIMIWEYMAGNWAMIDVDDTLATYEEGYYSFMVADGGTYGITADSNVPEPGHYAALAGLLTLGLVLRLRSKTRTV
ncbi:MAG: hypothetical protein ACQKBW_05470 [Puniceicoccales bacterium]